MRGPFLNPGKLAVRELGRGIEGDVNRENEERAVSPAPHKVGLLSYSDFSGLITAGKGYLRRKAEKLDTGDSGN